MLYDQDASIDTVHHDTTAGRRQRVLDRQRERELEWRREAEFERDRQARRRRVREDQRAEPPAGPLRISSRPGDTTARPGPARRPHPALDNAPPAAPQPAAPQPAAPPPASRGPATPRSAAPGPAAPGPAAPRPAAAGPAAPRPADPRGAPPPDACSRRLPPEPRVPSPQRATAILAAGTFVSRLTGFGRVLAIGYVLGVTSLSDAYNYANGIPNIIYDLLLGGILSATLIPVFVEQMRREERAESMRAISAVLSAITVALAAITAVLWLAAPWVIHFYLLLYPTSTAAAERALATRLLHYFVPQVFFLGAIVVSTALLNARRSFTAAAFSPVLNNVIAIGALLVTKVVASRILTNKTAAPAAVLQQVAHDQHAIWILGIGTTAGYVVQFLVQLPAMRRAGYQLHLVWDLHHPAVRRVARLSTWLIGVVIANQASLALVMILAGRVQGGVTAYQFSYQFFQLPYALIAVSVASALMPDLAERWTSGDRRGFERRFVAGLRVTLAVLVPVALAYVAVAQPFIQLAVLHGRVTESKAHLVGSSLALFAVGLPGFSAFFLLMRMYQAMQNARMMFWIYFLENGLTVVAALALDPILGVPGLALAWVGPYTVASLVAAYDLRRRVGPLGGAHTVRALVRILIASAISAGVVVAVGLPFPGKAQDAVLVGRLVAQIGAGTIAYLVLAKVLGIKELRPIVRLARRLAVRS
jgi:putative peptidoglycan lipid II flippase